MPPTACAEKGTPARFAADASPSASARVVVANVIKDVDELAVKVRSSENRVSLIEIRNAAITGGVMVVVFLIKFLLGK